MQSLLDELDIFKSVPFDFKQEIKKLFIFDDYDRCKNLIVITKDDKVYGLGANNYNALGFGHSYLVPQLTEIKELSCQNICEFYSGDEINLAQNKDNILFEWGLTTKGILWTLHSRGMIWNYHHFKSVERIDFFAEHSIEDICKGAVHTLALLSDGSLYGWGSNQFGELGLDRAEWYPNPTRITINSTDNSVFKYIYCRAYCSYAITTHGLLFSWGWNEPVMCGQGRCMTNVCKPRMVNLFNAEKISRSIEKLYILTKEGSIYFLCEGIYCPKKLAKCQTIIHDLPRSRSYIDTDFILARIGESIRPFNIYNCKSLVNLFSSVAEASIKLFGVTPNAIDYHMDGHTSDELFNDKFQFIVSIGKGEFGKVGKYFTIADNQVYAIKIIGFEENGDRDIILQEVEVMSRLNSKYVVQFKDHWLFENNICLQMEYCFDNLRDILKQKLIVFNRKEFEAMNSVEYFLSYRIFREITEALNYLHKMEPPLIHGNIKPENILIGTYKSKMICKIGDYGLSRFADRVSLKKSSVIKTDNYRVNIDGTYDTKIDMYSLGMIGCEIFGFDKDKYTINILFLLESNQ